MSMTMSGVLFSNRKQLALLLVAVIAESLSSLIAGNKFANSMLKANTIVSPAHRLYGLNFSPYKDGQDPNEACCRQITEAQLRERMMIVSPHTEWIRTFGCTYGLEESGRIAHQLGHKAAMGAWLGSESTEAGRLANEREIANLITKANSGEVDIAIIGSEVLLRGDLPEAKLITYIDQVRKAIPDTIPVTTADVYGVLLAHRAVIDTVDLVFVNYYPYWEGVSIDKAVAALHCWHQKILVAAKDKPVIVSETGWPSCGNVFGKAVPSPENASFYFLNFVSWARANNVQYFYFAAFDEGWKAKREGPQGACWGIWDKNGNLKPGMQKVFDGETIPDNWTVDEIPGGPGTPTIEFTFVPPLCSFENLQGRVLHVKPVEFFVAVYIYVSGWWTKPTFAQPLTRINCDGSWTVDITTGGIDERATKIIAFLVPDGYAPPLLGGARELPIALNSFPKVEVAREPTSVWPGDTDNDGKVDQTDVLPIGLYWKLVGLYRPNASMNWVAQCGQLWTPAQATYADANGDGKVDQADVLAIGLNWGKTHSTIIAKANHQTELFRSEQSATIAPEVNPVQAPSQEFFLRIKISEVTNLFGLSLELLYDQMPLLQILAVEPDSMFGSDVVFYSTVDTLNGKIAVGISRKAGQLGSSGTGSVVRVRAKISGKASDDTIISFALQNVIANDANGAPLELTPRSTSTTVLRTAVASEREMTLPAEYGLGQNYPNPFNPSTTFSFSLPRAGHVTLKVYNILGKEIATLVDQHLAAGRHEAIWNAGSVESGVYFYQLRTGEFVATNKLILMK